MFLVMVLLVFVSLLGFLTITWLSLNPFLNYVEIDSHTGMRSIALPMDPWV